MTTKKSIILSVATALTMGAQYMNDEAACAAMADMEAAFGKVIPMTTKKVTAKEISALLGVNEISTTAKKHRK